MYLHELMFMGMKIWYLQHLANSWNKYVYSCQGIR
jgi:hypothetical protein